MKKNSVFAVFAACVFAFTLMLQVAYAEDVATVENILYSDDFESYNEGDIPSNFVEDGFNGESTPTLAISDINGNKKLNLRCDAAAAIEYNGEIAYQKRFGQSGGSWKIRISSMEGAGSLGIGFRGTSSAQKMYPLMIKDEAFINGITGEYLMDCEKGREYQVELSYNAKNGELGIFVDGTELTSLDWGNIANSADLSASTTTLRIGFTGDDANNAITSFLIDDFVLSEPIMQIEDFAYFDESGNELSALTSGTVKARAKITSFAEQAKKIGMFTRLSNGIEVIYIMYAEYEVDQNTAMAEISFDIPNTSGSYEAETILVLPEDNYRPILKSVKID